MHLLHYWFWPGESGFSRKVVWGVHFRLFQKVLTPPERSGLYSYSVWLWNSMVLPNTPTFTIFMSSGLAENFNPHFDIQNPPFCPGPPQNTVLCFILYSKTTLLRPKEILKRSKFIFKLHRTYVSISWFCVAHTRIEAKSLP